jgi:hypothetical protein
VIAAQLYRYYFEFEELASKYESFTRSSKLRGVRFAKLPFLVVPTEYEHELVTATEALAAHGFVVSPSFKRTPVLRCRPSPTRAGAGADAAIRTAKLDKMECPVGPGLRPWRDDLAGGNTSIFGRWPGKVRLAGARLPGFKLWSCPTITTTIILMKKKRQNGRR